MADLTLLPAAITGVVQALSAFLTYRVGMRQAEKKPGTDPPAPPRELAREQAHSAVKAAVERYGNEDERGDLAAFERNPERYRDALTRVITDLASREPTFARQVVELAGRLGEPPAGDHYSQTVIGDENATSVHGPATVNAPSVHGPAKVKIVQHEE